MGFQIRDVPAMHLFLSKRWFAAGNYSQEGGGDGGEPALALHLLLSEL